MTRILNVEPSRYDAETRDLLGRAGEVDYVDCPDQAAFLRALSSAPYDAVFVRLGLALDREALAAAPGLRFAVTPTTGLDHIDVSALTERGGRLIALKGETAFLEGIRSTAEHTFALLLALSRRLPAAHADVTQAGNWRREPFLARELHDHTLGIVGFGRLGRMVAGYGLAFGMKVLATDTDPSAFSRGPTVEQVDPDELLARSDVLSLHLPLVPETKGWLSRERLARLPEGAWLVNTARGELVDEVALLEALQSGRLAGAAADVLHGDGRWAERVPDAHPLVSYAREHDNLILTPHVGGYGRHATFGTRRFVVQRFLEALR